MLNINRTPPQINFNIEHMQNGVITRCRHAVDGNLYNSILKAKTRKYVHTYAHNLRKERCKYERKKQNN